jgi:hypothetical protein
MHKDVQAKINKNINIYRLYDFTIDLLINLSNVHGTIMSVA